MMLVYPNFNLRIKFEDGIFWSVIVENQNLFYEMISDLNLQTEGNDGKFVLSENGAPIEIRKYLELITQLVPFSVNRKDILVKLYGNIQKNAMCEKMMEKTNAILAALEHYIYEITEDYATEIYATEISSNRTTDITPLLKMFDVKFDEGGKDLCERLLDYINVVEMYKGKKLFVIVNLRDYVNDEDAEKLTANLVLRKVNFLCIESCERLMLKKEQRWIIDKDLCVI